MTNIDEVNRLLAEVDSSSEEEDMAKLTGRQDHSLESLLASSKAEPPSQRRSMAVKPA